MDGDRVASDKEWAEMTRDMPCGCAELGRAMCFKHTASRVVVNVTLPEGFWDDGEPLPDVVERFRRARSLLAALPPQKTDPEALADLARESADLDHARRAANEVLLGPPDDGRRVSLDKSARMIRDRYSEALKRL